jgi:precorrin-8X/cobalt-precorrin-8 methylmutase
MRPLEYIKNPSAIEERSFELISELRDFSAFDETQQKIIKRVIHTTADFEYADIIQFSSGAIEAGLQALREGCNIVSDTKMIQSGINKRALGAFGCDVKCFIDHPDVASMAKEQGMTRSMASMIMASRDADNKVFVLGNAPTALYKAMELANNGIISPAMIIGVPVGFVGAEESKECLLASDIPHIVTRGRKGGSTVAVAIVNALLYILRDLG